MVFFFAKTGIFAIVIYSTREEGKAFVHAKAVGESETFTHW
jgi:hypothetical protein